MTLKQLIDIKNWHLAEQAGVNMDGLDFTSESFRRNVYKFVNNKPTTRYGIIPTRTYRVIQNMFENVRVSEIKKLYII